MLENVSVDVVDGARVKGVLGCPSVPGRTEGAKEQCSTFTGMRDLRESNNLQKRINSGIYTISIPDTTLKQSIKLYAGITTISIISKDIQGYKYMDIHGYPGQPAHEGY